MRGQTERRLGSSQEEPSEAQSPEKFKKVSPTYPHMQIKVNIKPSNVKLVCMYAKIKISSFYIFR